MSQPEQTPPQPWVPPTPGPRPSRAKIALIGCGALVGGVLLLALLGSIVGPPKKTVNTSAAAPATAKPTASQAASTPTQAPSPSKTVSPTPAAPSSPVAAPSTTAPVPALPSVASPTMALADKRQKAAAILRANDAYYQTEFNQGVDVITARGTAGSFDAFHAWYQKASTDVQPSIDAFKQADANFDASNEPASISDWQNDNGTLAADVFGLANDGADVGGPNDAEARQKVQADVTKMATDFATAEQDAANVEAGK